MFRKIISLLVLFLPIIAVKAQENTLYFMQTLAQSRNYNPALMPKFKTTIGLPGISSNYFSFHNSGFNYNDLVRRRSEDDSLEIDLQKFYQKLGNKNYLNLTQESDIFHLTMKVNPVMYLSFNVTEKAFARVMYPKSLMEFLIEGNANMIGGEVQFSPELEAFSYLEYGFGSAFRSSEKFTIGTRFKLLKGLANATTKNADISMATDQNYHLTFTGDAEILTSGLNQIDQLDSGNLDFNRVMSMIGNSGYALDFGMTWEPNQRWLLGISLIDLGMIFWKNDLKSYNLNSEKPFIYNGLDIAAVIEGESALIDDAIDSLTNHFEFEEQVGIEYNTWLPAKMLISGKYTLARNLTAGVLFYGEKFRSRLNLGASANLTKDVGKFMSFSMSYSANQRSYNNLGAGLAIKLLPLQIYVVGDNLLGAPLALATSNELNPYLNNLKVFTLRFGINLTMGWDKTETKLPDDQLF
jgi:hypothetical protein